MIFPCLETEDVVQVGDSLRLSACKSFVSKDEDSISKVQICPEWAEYDAEWIDVSASGDDDETILPEKDWFLDWRYSGVSRSVTAKVRVYADSEDEYEETERVISVLSVDDDKLFSVDTDLIALE